MADLGELSARITAQISDFEQNMDRASGKTADFANEAQASGKKGGAGLGIATKAMVGLKVAAVAAAAAAAAGAAAIVMLGRRGMAAADEQAKLARQLGITNAELATLERAAEFAGMSSSALQSNMERLNRSMGEAMSGSGQAADAFERLGVDLDDLMSMNADAQMLHLADAMDGLGTRAEQAAVAQQLFGRSGQQMLVFLDDAEANIGRASEQVEAFGLALDEVDTARIESANDAMSSIGAVIAGIGNRIAARVAPLIEHLALKFEEVAIETRGFESVVDGVFNFVIRAAGIVANAIEGIRRVFAAVQHAGRVMGNIVIQVFANIMNGISNLVDGAVGALNVMIDTANKLPFVEIERMALMAERNFMVAINRMSDESSQSVADSRQNIEDMMSKPWPSEGIDSFLEGLEEIERATETIRNSPAPIPGTGDADDDGADGIDYERELDRLREFMMSQEELLEHQMTERFNLLHDARAAEEIDELEYMTRMEQLHATHMDKLLEIKKQGLSEMERFQAMSWHQQTAIVAGELAGLTNNLDRENKAQFEIAKAGAVAQALVNTYLGVSQSLASYPMPLAGIMAAAHGAAGAAAVANIMSQQYGSGGSAAGAGASPAPAPTAQAAPQESRSLLVQGDFDSSSLFTGEAVRGLIDRIAEAQNDGYTVVV